MDAMEEMMMMYWNESIVNPVELKKRDENPTNLRNARFPDQQTDSFHGPVRRYRIKLEKYSASTPGWWAYTAINSDKRIPSGRRALNVPERIVCQRTMLTMVATLLLLLAYVCHVRYVSVCGLLFGVSVLPAEKRSILARVHMNVGTKQCSFCARKERKSQAKERV